MYTLEEYVVYDMFEIGKKLPDGRIALVLANRAHKVPGSWSIDEQRYQEKLYTTLLFDPKTGELEVEVDEQGNICFVFDNEITSSISNGQAVFPEGVTEIHIMPTRRPDPPPPPGKWDPGNIVHAYIDIRHHPGQCTITISFPERKRRR